MAHQETVLTAFVASPSDVGDERALLEEIVREFNVTWSRQFGLRIELIKWETHSYPSVGDHAQSVINKEIGDDYDIFIGIMWSRFGTPTLKSGSGTEEEFERAFARHKKTPGSVTIMFYFKDTPVPPSRIDAAQLSKVLNFKDRLGKAGVYYWSFSEREQFARILRLHLSNVIQAWLKNTPPLQIQAPTIAPDQLERRGGEMSIADEEPGLLDLFDSSIEAGALATASIDRLGAATLDVAKSIEERTNELKVATQTDGKIDFQLAKRVSNRAAQDLDVFVARTEAELPIFSHSYRVSLDQVVKAVNLGIQDFNTNRRSVEALREALVSHSHQIPELRLRIKGLRDSIANCPRATSQFNRAQRKSVQALDKLILELDIAFQSNADVVKLFGAIVAGM